jgi:diacylglycerol kinase (ATP)
MSWTAMRRAMRRNRSAASMSDQQRRATSPAFIMPTGGAVPERALLLINRKSRHGESDNAAIQARFKIAGIDAVCQTIDRPGQIAESIGRHRPHIDRIVIGGGDGSMNAALAPLLDARLPLGILPLGTANDLARTLGIPADIDAAIDIIGRGIVHPIDVGNVNGHYFFNVANIGVGVEVMHKLSAELKRRLGVLSYAHCLFKVIKSYRPFRAEIVCDGHRMKVRSIQVAIGNGRHYGGGMTVGEQAWIDDGRLCLYSLAPATAWELLKLAPALRSGRFDQVEPIQVAEGAVIELTTRHPMAVTADGELLTHTPARFSVLRGAIGVFVPETYLTNRQETAHAA